jgi:nitronate monooxygenase
VAYTRAPVGEHTEPLAIGARGRQVYLTPRDKIHADAWIDAGFTEAMKTPDATLIFVTPEKSAEIRTDQQACMGCLSACRFSNWAENEAGTTGKPADPRSFCIQKTLQEIAHDGDVEWNLLFAGHNAYKFAEDPFYSNGFVPTVGQLIERILTGD